MSANPFKRQRIVEALLGARDENTAEPFRSPFVYDPKLKGKLIFDDCVLLVVDHHTAQFSRKTAVWCLFMKTEDYEQFADRVSSVKVTMAGLDGEHSEHDAEIKVFPDQKDITHHLLRAVHATHDVMEDGREANLSNFNGNRICEAILGEGGSEEVSDRLMEFHDFVITNLTINVNTSITVRGTRTMLIDKCVSYTRAVQ